MKKYTIILSFIITIAIATLCEAGTFYQFYTIQVKALPMGQYKEGIQLYSRLKDKGYLAHFYKIKIKDKWWFRLRVGYFKDRNRAKKYGEEFRKKEGLEYYVDKARLYVDRFDNIFDIVTTPSALWMSSEKGSRLLYSLDKKTVNKGMIINNTRALVSPSGTEIVFYYDEKIIKVNVDSGKSIILKKGVYDSAPKWSPDGRYIAYLDYNEWEVETSLWLIKPDGTQDTCIVKHGKTQYAVKSFTWHPDQNSIFFIEGYAYGTVSVGGKLYVLDIQGKKKKLVIEPKKRYDEIVREFYIHSGKLYYKVAHFDDNMMNVTFTRHSVELEKLVVIWDVR